MRIPKYILILFLLNGLFLQSQSLKEYRWKNRLIILVHNGEDSELFQTQRESLLEESNALKERDLILIYLDDESVEVVSSNVKPIDILQLRKELEIDSGFQGLILIGKDGGVKMREKFHVKSQKIFDLIDSMPMRQSEMKN